MASDKRNVKDSTTVHEVKALILSYHPVVVIETVEEERLEQILDSVAAQLRIPLFDWSVTHGFRKRGQRAPIHRTNEPLMLLKHLAGLTVDGVYFLKDFAPYFENNEVLRQFRELCQAFSNRRSTLVISGSQINLPEEIAYQAVHYEIRLPTESELREAMEGVLESVRAQRPFRIELGPGGLTELIRAMSGMTLKQARQAVAYCILRDGELDPSDIQAILERKSQAIREAGLLEYYPFSANKYELGGFGNLRRWLDRARTGFSRKARQLNLTPPRGILLVGVQGCGKSLASKFVAREWALPLLKLDAARLFDKYIGESEKNFHKAVRQAESMTPVVLWIDEIEKGFSSSSSSEADGGLSRRLLGSFLTWLQEKKADVFVVATANDLDSLPPEFLRKGRFDEIFFVDLPNEEERRSILEIHLTLRKQDATQFKLDRIVGATEGFSGAEIEQLVITALYHALYRGEPLSTEILLQEAGDTIPLSVSRQEEISELRAWAKSRFVSVR